MAEPSSDSAPAEILRPRLAGVEVRPVVVAPDRALAPDEAAAEQRVAADRTVARRAVADGFWRELSGADARGFEIRWNAWTGLPHRVYGAGLSVFREEGGLRRAAPLATAAQAEASARTFLAQATTGWAGEETPADADLALIKSTKVGATWFLVFQQRHRGVDVDGGRVDLRLREDGTIVLFGSDWFPGIAVDPSSGFAQGVADARARTAVGFDASRDRALGGKRVILPVPHADGTIDYRVAHVVRHRIESPPALWRSYVDANTGEILARENDLRFDDLVGKVEGRIHPNTWTDPFVTVPFRDHVVATGLDSTFTDASGRYVRPNTIMGTVMRFGLRGPFLEVIHTSANEAYQQFASPANDTLNVLWTPANSDTAERDTWYHAHLAREYVKRIDPGFVALDYRMPCTVNINSLCNAFWDGVGINFFRWGIRPADGRACANTGTISDVIYHEFGHGRTQEVWAPLFPSGAMHEGLSDYLAATMTNQPVIGRGFFGAGTQIRSAENTTQINEPSCLGAVHCMGTALAGSLWDTREALIASYGDPADAIDHADSLFHYAGYGAAPWHDDYLLDLLVVDDDDGTLLNGTPRYGQICPSFAAHGIPCPDTTSGVWFVHTPPADVGLSTGPVVIQARMGSFAGSFLPGSARIFIRAPSDFLPNPFNEFPMTHLGGDLYQYTVSNSGPLSGAIEYYFTGGDNTGHTGTSPAAGPDAPYRVYVGALIAVWEDDFETDRGWTSIVPPGVTGRWMRVDPHGTQDDFDPTFLFQSPDDHTPGPGIFAYVTGDTANGNPAGAADVDGGCVTLLSPVIDLSTTWNARLEYWRWFTDETRLDDSLVVSVSPDNGVSWFELERQPFTQNSWLAKTFRLEDYVPLTDQMRLRYVTCDGGGGSLLEGGLDDVKITTRSAGAVAVGDDPTGSSVPAIAFLGRPAPNPAVSGAQTRVDFGVPRVASGDAAVVRLVVLDARGRIVRRLIDESRAPGRYTAVWDGADEGGVAAAPGVYFLHLDVDGTARTEKTVRLH
ncbi:MAG: FlgD immunoglobulin-like domain containing protein [Candidatus Eiseniibacteriota bacterium]